MIRVEVKGQTLEFPDNTPDDVIDKAVQRDFFSTPAKESPPTEKPQAGSLMDRLSLPPSPRALAAKALVPGLKTPAFQSVLGDVGLSKETMEAARAAPGILSELAGAEDAALRTAGAMASREGALMLAAGVAGPAVALPAFAAYGVTQVPSAVRETKEAFLHGKPGDIGKVLFNDAVNTAMIAAPFAPRTVAAMRDTMSAKLPSEPAGAMTERLTAKGESPSGVAAKPAAEAIQELRPAILTMDGGLVAGKQGQVHDDIIAENKLTPENIDRRTFVDAQGNEVQRAEAAQVTGIPTERVPGELHASELAKAQAEAPKERIPFQELADEVFNYGAGEQSWLKKYGDKGLAGMPLRQDLERLIGRKFSEQEWNHLQEQKFLGEEESGKIEGVSPEAPKEVAPAPRSFSMQNGRVQVEIAPPYEVGGRPQQIFRVNGDPVMSLDELKSKYPPVYERLVSDYPEFKPASAPPAKEPWQMTRAEVHSGEWDVFNRDTGEKYSKPGEHTLNLEIAHRAAIRKAIAEGKPVPPEVLADYPDLKPAEAKDVIGPGAQTAGQPMPPAIEQLRQAFKGLEGERVPFRTKIERAFDIGQQLSTVKDAVGRALSGLKAGGEYLLQKWQGYGELDDLLKAKGELSAATEQRGYLGMKWAKEVQRAFPDIEERKAITSWVDVGGDMAKLKQAETEVPSGRKAPYKKAQNLSPDAKLAAQQIQNHFEAKLQEAIDAGVLEDGIEDYIHRIYERAPVAAKNQALATARSGILSTNPSLARKRVFEMDFEAEKAGFLPVKDFIPRILDYETSLNRAIAARQFVAKVAGTPAKKASGGQPAVKATKGMTTADGSPMVVTAGKGIPIEDASGVRQGTLIKPASVTEEMMKNYVHRDYPALNRWKWVGEDADGKPIMLKGDLMIHKDYVKRFDRLLKPSFVRESPVGRAALGVSSTFKQTMMDFSAFHQVQMAVHGAEHRVMPWQITKDIDFTDPNVEGLLKGGMTLGGEFHLESEGLYGSTLSKMVPVLNKISHDYHQYLFRDFIPRLKTTMALDALERNRVRYSKELASGKMTEDDLHFLTARQANAAFGELNYTMLERSKGVQDLARLTMLAPDFLEARARFAGQALTKHGAEQRMALFLGALVMYTTARIFNKVSTGDYHMEPEHAFSAVHDKRAYSLRTVQGDILHAWDKPLQFALYRLNPLTTRMALQAAAGRNEFGTRRSGLETVWDTVSSIAPISFRSGKDKSLWESVMSAFGVNTRRYKETTDILKTVAEWKKANKIGPPGEFIYNPDADPYHKLNLALADNDDGKAVAEIKRLIDTKTKTASEMRKHFDEVGNRPIISAANELKFKKTLTEDQKKSFQVAEDYRKQMPLLYTRAFAKYLAALRNPTP